MQYELTATNKQGSSATKSNSSTNTALHAQKPTGPERKNKAKLLLVENLLAHPLGRLKNP